jgi:hypothetical protein
MQEWYERSIQLITAKVCYTYENTDKKIHILFTGHMSRKVLQQILFTSHHLY